MPVPFLDIKIREPRTRERIVSNLASLIDTTSFIGGKEVQSFADEFGAYCQGRCVPVANGTDALILALRALGVHAGDEVITVPFTFIASAEAISVVGARVRFVDIHPKSYTLDPAQLERAITPRTKAIMPVHLFGQTADMEPIMTIAKRHGLAVVEDACQAHGAEYKGRKAGALGDIAAFSFYPTKNLGGFGDGGAVVSVSDELLKKVALIADHGRTERYVHAVEGINSRLDTMQAAVLRLKLAELDARNDRRRAIAEAYGKALSTHRYLTTPVIERYAKHVFHIYAIETAYRDALERHLRGRGIGCGVYYPIPLHMQPAYAPLGYKRGDFPVSERLAERILALPMFPEMTDADVSEVLLVLKEFVPSEAGAGAS